MMIDVERVEITPEDIVRMAADGTPPEGLNHTQELLYWRVKDIYDRYKTGGVNKATGASLKETALRQYAAEEKRRQSTENIIMGISRFYAAIENAAIEYAKAPSIETADAFFKAVNGGAERKHSVTDIV